MKTPNPRGILPQWKEEEVQLCCETKAEPHWSFDPECQKRQLAAGRALQRLRNALQSLHDARLAL